MAQIKTVTIGMTDSIKVGDYQYVKPTMEFVVEFKDGEKVSDFLEEAEMRLLKEMNKFRDRILVEKLGKEFD